MSEQSNRPPARAELAPELFAAALRSFAKASTLPAEAFTSPAIYEREVEELFLRGWLCAGRADQIPEVGDYFTLDLLGDRLVVVRGRDGETRALSRVCRHRAAQVVSGAGNARSFQCPYHAWTYALDGQLLGAPFMDDVDNFDRGSCRLPEVRSELWEGWIFVNFDSDAAPLGPQLAPLSKLLEGYGMSQMVAVETATYESRFNWKVLADNFMEAYHHIGVHRDTLEPLFPAARSHTPENEGPYSLLYMPGKQDPVQTEEGIGDQGLIAAAVFPFHLFAPNAESLAWYQILPETFDRFTLRIFNCFPREVLDDPEAAESIHNLQTITKVVHEQDIAACEGVWSGLNSRSFENGPLCPLEKPIWQFNQWWVERLTDPL